MFTAAEKKNNFSNEGICTQVNIPRGSDRVAEKTEPKTAFTRVKNLVGGISCRCLWKCKEKADSVQNFADYRSSMPKCLDEAKFSQKKFPNIFRVPGIKHFLLNRV